MTIWFTGKDGSLNMRIYNKGIGEIDVDFEIAMWNGVYNSDAVVLERQTVMISNVELDVRREAYPNVDMRVWSWIMTYRGVSQVAIVCEYNEMLKSITSNKDRVMSLFILLGHFFVNAPGLPRESRPICFHDAEQLFLMISCVRAITSRTSGPKPATYNSIYNRVEEKISLLHSVLLGTM